MRATEVNRRIERLGGEFVRQRGSHRRYRVVTVDDAGKKTTYSTTVSQHSGDVPIGTLKSIDSDLAPAFGEGWLT